MRRSAGQRWQPVPEELLEEMAALCPLEDGGRERRVFSGLDAWKVRDGLALACRDAGIVHYSRTRSGTGAARSG